MPETHFLDIETLKDVTPSELQYVIGNILRSSRYGAMTSRLGRVRNTLTAIIFSDTEIFSNLELTQHVYDLLKGTNKELAFPLMDQTVKESVKQATNTLLKRVVGQTPVVVRGEVLDQVIEETIMLYRDEAVLQALLHDIDQGYQVINK